MVKDMKYCKKILSALLILTLALSFSACNEKAINNGSTNPTEEEQQSKANTPNYGLSAGFSEGDNLLLTYNGKPLSFEYSLYNPEASAEWGIEVYVDGILQNITVYSENTSAAQNTNMYVTNLENGERKIIRIEFMPNTGKAGETLELNVCSFLNPDYMIDGTDYTSFLTFHRLSPGYTMKIQMNKDAQSPVKVAEFNGRYEEVPQEIIDSFNSINSSNEIENVYDRQQIFDICKSDENESVINLSGKRDTLEVFGYGKPGTYRISVYINNQIIKAFDGEYYCDAEVKENQKFLIEIPVEVENEKNHIYIVVLELGDDSDVTNNYIKSNTKLLLVN